VSLLVRIDIDRSVATRLLGTKVGYVAIDNSLNSSLKNVSLGRCLTLRGY